MIEKDGEPWFVAKDVCDVLEIANVSQAVGKLDEDEKGICLNDTVGKSNQFSIISKPDFYSLVGRSRKPETIARHCKAQATVTKRDGGFRTLILERDIYRLVMNRLS